MATEVDLSQSGSGLRERLHQISLQHGNYGVTFASMGAPLDELIRTILFSGDGKSIIKEWLKPYGDEVAKAVLRYEEIPDALAIVVNHIFQASCTSLLVASSYEGKTLPALELVRESPAKRTYAVRNITVEEFRSGLETHLVRTAARIFDQDVFYQAAARFEGEELKVVMDNLFSVALWTQDSDAVSEAVKVAYDYKLMEKTELVITAMDTIGRIANLMKDPQAVKVATGVLNNNEFQKMVNAYGKYFLQDASRHLIEWVSAKKYVGVDPRQAAQQYLRTTTLSDLTLKPQGAEIEPQRGMVIHHI